MDMVFKLLDEDREVKDVENAKPLKHKQGEIRFENVNFSYQEERKILHDISFTVKPGQKLAIVGHSGSGKSTLARLLFRFYNMNSGRILYDDQDISQVTQDSLRQAIGIVPQDTVLFNESILYNIEYAKTGATKEEIIRAAKLANIHYFIDSLPDGYDTTVGVKSNALRLLGLY
jgi:ATP-binding cassette subfamily B protein